MQNSKNTMEMGSQEGVTPVRPENELYVCSACSYMDGFHVSFRKMNSTGTWEIILICPSCHKRFSVSWEVMLVEK